MHVPVSFGAACFAAALVLAPIATLAQGVPLPQPPPSRAPAQPAPPADPGSEPLSLSESLIRIGPNHYIRQGRVEIHDAKNKTDIYADLVEFFEDEDRAVAVGNVVLSQGTNRISAERAEFNTQSGLGTFYNASGIATVTPPRQQTRPGSFAPPPVGGDTLVYFFGETVEKVAPKKYKITKGGFSTCVQPTPRWEMSASTLVLNLDHYTLLKNAVMTVKGVPMLYLPVMYYPTRRDSRATGFLLPTYGASSLHGQSIHNGFFWAINRSQDATVMHDWFSKTGQGLGSEYRYNYGNGTDGNLRAYFLDQKEVQYVLSDGSLGDVIPASQSYELRGGANQRLPGHMMARGSIDYFSSLATSQTFNTNIYDLSRNSRRYGGNLIGAWGGYSLNATLQHDEYFYNADESILTGTWPRVAFTRSERPIASTPLYFSLGGEIARQLRDTNTTVDGETVTDSQSLSRFDINPQLRIPFKRWQWLTANSTVTARETYYTRSYAPTGDPLIRPSVVTDEPLNRPVLAFQSQIVGPLFNRIWDTPSNGYAEKFKHSIEPFVTILKTANVENYDRVIQFDGIDSYVGGTTYQYGLANRIYAKRRLQPGQPAQAREIAAVEISQSYYTNQNQAIYDRQYQSTSLGDTPPSHFSAIQLSVRATPTNDINTTVRAEFDSQSHELMTISAQGTLTITSQLQAQAGWSKRAFVENLSGFNDKNNLDHFVNGSGTFRTRDNKYGTTYTFNYDVLHSALLQQRLTGFYNAQCCGLAMEYQTVNYGSFSNIPADHRFFLSFTLAGLGNFSPFNGAMSGVPR
jgi:LPS-assembly protein